MDAEEDGDAVVAVGHVGGHALLQEETESGADTRCDHTLHDCRSPAFLVFMTLSLVSCNLNSDPQKCYLQEHQHLQHHHGST